MTTEKAGLAKLREPFAENQINQLPKPYKAESPKGRCAECGGWHGLPAAHLDYVGHAALTDRLLDADPEWTWEFVATEPTTGMPVFDQNGGLWIRLTVCGVTRLGYGDAQGKKGGNAVKEAIGDALRNAGMRFGAALELWHKGDLHDASVERGDGEAERLTADPKAPAQERVQAAMSAVAGATTLAELDKVWQRVQAGGLDGTGPLPAAYGAQKKNLAGTEEPPDPWEATPVAPVPA